VPSLQDEDVARAVNVGLPPAANIGRRGLSERGNRERDPYRDQTPTPLCHPCSSTSAADRTRRKSFRQRKAARNSCNTGSPRATVDSRDPLAEPYSAAVGSF